MFASNTVKSIPAEPQAVYHPASNPAPIHSHQGANPTYIGPGTWNVIHMLAFQAKTKPKQDAFIITMKTICNHFPCEVCRKHAKSYLKQNPIEEYKNVSYQNIKGVGMFVWTWKFHNAVNYRIGKNSMSWEAAYSIFKSNNESCEECSS
jgi:hypothetical protein